MCQRTTGKQPFYFTAGLFELSLRIVDDAFNPGRIYYLPWTQEGSYVSPAATCIIEMRTRVGKNFS